MQALTCPIPENISLLQNNGFIFGIQKLPEIQFFCQEVNIPELILPMAEVGSPLVISRLPGDRPIFGDLTVQFLINEDMSNYIAIHNWLIGMSFPETWGQYTSFIASRGQSANGFRDSSEAAAAVSDATLQILGSNNNVVQSIQFVDMFPTSLNSLQLQSTTTETVYLAGIANFGYTHYKFT